jgi:hypothetical protein
VISIPSIAPSDSAVLSLETPIDEVLLNFLYEDGPANVRVIFSSADQVGTFTPKISLIDAMELVQRENQIRTGERSFVAEKIEVIELALDDPHLKDADVSNRLLPDPLLCPPAKQK